MGVSDCHFNIAIIYKKLLLPHKSLEHFDKTLKIRIVNKGTLSLTVSNVLEEIGKLLIETGQYSSASAYLKQCLEIRKRLVYSRNKNFVSSGFCF